MQRLNFTLDDATVELLETLSSTDYAGNKSQTVRAALESLAAHTRHMGWVTSVDRLIRIRTGEEGLEAI